MSQGKSKVEGRISATFMDYYQIWLRSASSAFTVDTMTYILSLKGMDELDLSNMKIIAIYWIIFWIYKSTMNLKSFIFILNNFYNCSQRKHSSSDFSNLNLIFIVLCFMITEFFHGFIFSNFNSFFFFLIKWNQSVWFFFNIGNTYSMKNKFFLAFWKMIVHC